MADNDATKDCSWLGKGFVLEERDESEIEYVEGSTEPDFDMPDTPNHYETLQKDMKKDPCAVCRAMAKAWNDVSTEFKDDPDVMFGDVVLSDPAVKAVADKMKDGFKPTGLGYGGAEDYKGEGEGPMDDDMLEAEDTFDESEDGPKQYDSKFEKEVANFAHHPDYGGCIFAQYNQESEANDQPWYPHCIDMLQPHEFGESWDENGDIVPPTPEEAEEREAMAGKLALHQFVKDTKQMLAYHFERLEHTDEL